MKSKRVKGGVMESSEFLSFSTMFELRWEMPSVTKPTESFPFCNKKLLLAMNMIGYCKTRYFAVS